VADLLGFPRDILECTLQLFQGRLLLSFSMVYSMLYQKVKLVGSLTIFLLIVDIGQCQTKVIDSLQRIVDLQRHDTTELHNLLLSQSIQSMLRLNENIQLLGAYENPVEVGAHLALHKPDLLIMDIDMLGMNGIEAVTQVRLINKSIPILMLTVFDDNQHVFDAICAGASGYLLKKHISSKLFSAIEEVLEGGAPMSPSIARMVLASMHEKKSSANPYQLTPKEKEVLTSLSKGNSYKLIASEVDISIDTVRSHIRKIYEKLHVHSQGEAVSKAINEKLI
jgi:DNA-binding NarL/FixJ family response regulator